MDWWVRCFIRDITVEVLLQALGDIAASGRATAVFAASTTVSCLLDQDVASHLSEARRLLNHESLRHMLEALYKKPMASRKYQHIFDSTEAFEPHLKHAMRNFLKPSAAHSSRS